jgi:ribonuclease R
MPSFAERIRAIAAREQLSESFPRAVLAEVDGWLRRPEIDAPELVDWTALPFVTLDGPGTMDLDQALLVAPEGDGFRLRYAIADASHYVRPGSALFAEALGRGATYYLPGLSVPMLPRPLSEGLISLGPGQPRRALAFDVMLDRRGGVVDWGLCRVRVRSQAKLTFAEVDELGAASSGSRLGAAPFAESLRLLAALGRLRAAHEDRRQMVRYRRVESGPWLDGAGQLRLRHESRSEAELANEQVSILCNALGARFLAQSNPDQVQPIYRVHAPPDPERLASFERLVGDVAKDRALPDDPWVYRRAAELGLAGYLETLPTVGAEGRLARALHRQAMLLNGRSLFSVEAGAHFGVGEAAYSRFTAPMREIVGVFCHKEALERLGDNWSRSRAEDEALRLAVVEAANHGKEVQRRIDHEIDELVLEALFGAELRQPVGDRPVRTGTVMGLTSSKIHVLLGEPEIDVKIPLRELGRDLGGAWLDVEGDGARLTVRGTGVVVCRLGDQIEVRSSGPPGVVQLVGPPPVGGQQRTRVGRRKRSRGEPVVREHRPRGRRR